MIHRSIQSGRGTGARHVRGQSGFSLLEMLIVVAIMGLLATLVLTKIGGVFGKSQVKVTKAQIEIATHAVERFNMDMSRYPTEAEGLQILVKGPANEPNWHGPYFDKETLPKDGWGNALVYESDETWGFRIKSLGADGKPGGEGENADLDNRQ